MAVVTEPCLMELGRSKEGRQWPRAANQWSSRMRVKRSLIYIEATDGVIR